MGGKRGYNSEVRTTQLQVFAIPFCVNSDGTNTNLEGSGDVSVTKNGTGDYTITLLSPANRNLVPSMPIAETANLKAQLVSKSSSAVRFLFSNNSGTATDTAFCGVVWGSDDLALRG